MLFPSPSGRGWRAAPGEGTQLQQRTVNRNPTPGVIPGLRRAQRTAEPGIHCDLAFKTKWITKSIHGLCPSGRPSVVQIRSRRICPAFAGMTSLPL
ncbi:MAG: hypothetical protein OJF55_002026 [Rhodanobacteraceae bacterium]|nr:MAG: hypothetical protein OJF55_002026 [Rhodanobacteraceae bacterium]